MKRECPYCEMKNSASEFRKTSKKAGRFKRKSDSKSIQRFRCLRCFRTYSNATFHSCYRQNKRQMNRRFLRLYCSGVSLRRSAILLNVSRTTVARKLTFLGAQCALELERTNKMHPPSNIVEFDDQETFEHTKCKPLSITLAVEHRTRRILGFEVARMPAKGHLAKIARKKYGPRIDERPLTRQRLFTTLTFLVSPKAKFKSDESPLYVSDLKRIFPQAYHERHKGQRGSIVGQGELKKVRFDPLFSINHTFAMTRANMNRLFRKTWCTTKKPENLAAHLAIYALYHNLFLIKRPAETA